MRHAAVLPRKAPLVVALTAFFLAAGLDEAEARRLALVVGNGDYAAVPSLKNARRDAEDIAAALKRVGFEVTLLTEVRGADFWPQVDAFAARAQGAESTLFYYSGHAFQMSGVNYLVPVDARLQSREAILAETWSLDGVIARIQDRRRQTLIFLDACRNDPLPRSVRGSGAADGLARLQTGVGTFVAFATEPGAVSYDGAGGSPNSPFTAAVLKYIGEPGLSVSDMMIKVRNEVEDVTLRRQTPWDQSSLREQFYFTAPQTAARQELSEADYELLAALSPGDRAKFLDLLRASGFSEESLRRADEAISIAQANFEIAAEAGVTVGLAAAGAAPVVHDSGMDLAALEVVQDGSVVIGGASGAVPTAEPPAVVAALDAAPALSEGSPDTPAAEPPLVVAALDPVAEVPAFPGLAPAAAPATPEAPAAVSSTPAPAAPSVPALPSEPAQAPSAVADIALPSAPDALAAAAPAPVVAEPGPMVAAADPLAAAPALPGFAADPAPEQPPLVVAAIVPAEAPAAPAAPAVPTDPAADMAVAAALPTVGGLPPLGAELGPPVRLAALTWETRGILEIAAQSEEGTRIAGREVTADNDEGRAVLAAIDPRLLDDDGFAIGEDPKVLARQAQEELRRLGCYQMKVDGSWGNGSRAALTSYFLAKRVVPSSLEPTPELVGQLRSETKVVCEVRVAKVVVPGKTKAILPAAAPAAASDTRRVNKATGRVVVTKEERKTNIGKSLLNPGGF